MIAKQLIVTAKETNSALLEESLYEFYVYEFQDGLILVIGVFVNDWFYEDRKSIKAYGSGQVISVTETLETIDWSLERLQESIKDSLADVPPKALAMLS